MTILCAVRTYGRRSSASRRGGLITVAVVLCLAIVGTASAYAYRTFFGGGAPGIPPVIKADTAPEQDRRQRKRRGDQQADRGSDGRPGSKRARCSARGAAARPQAVRAADASQRVGGWPLPPGSPPVSAAPSGPSPSPSSSDPRPVKTVAISPTAGQAAPQSPPSAPVAKPPSDTGSVATRAPEPAHGSAARRAEQSDAARFTKRGCTAAARSHSVRGPGRAPICRAAFGLEYSGGSGSCAPIGASQIC